MRKSTKFFGFIAVAGMIAASGSAFTATNTVAASSAGSGTATISGYDVSAIKLNANATDPQILDSVTFTLDKTAGYVAMRTHDGQTVWVTSDDGCTNVGLTWTCVVTGQQVADATKLSVVATS